MLFIPEGKKNIKFLYYKKNCLKKYMYILSFILTNILIGMHYASSTFLYNNYNIIALEALITAKFILNFPVFSP